MDTFLQVLGIIGATILGILVVGIIAIVVWLRKVGFSITYAGTPSRIHVRNAAVAWKDVKQLQKSREELQRLGFAELGNFAIDEMPSVYLNAFIQTDEKAIAVLYEHPQVGQWIDFVAEFESGGTITVSSAITGHELDHRPNHEKIYIAKAPIATLREKFIEGCASRTRVDVPNTAEGFIAKIEQAYKDDMDWRNSRGGASIDELRRVATESGIKIDEEGMARAHLVHQTQAYEALVEALKETLRDKGAIPTASCDEFEESLLFVHDQMSPALLSQLLSDAGLADEELAAAPFTEPNTLKTAFARWNSSLPPNKRFQKIATLSEPTEVDVYRSRIRSAADA